MSAPAISIADVLAHLEASIADARLSDAERRELMVLLRAAATPEEGLRQVRNRAFGLVRERIGDAQQQGLLKWLDGVARSLDTVRSPVAALRNEAFFSPGLSCLRAIQQRLRAARDSVDICVFTLSDDRISEDVLAAHRRGVKVRIVTDNDKEFDAGSDIDRLRRAGVPVAVDRGPAHMHHKFAVFDSQWLINGSYNWTRSASEHNEENVIMTNDAALVSAFSAQFSLLWNAFREPSPGGAR